MTGPLAGLRVVELGGIGPGPFAGMLLADMGADVVRIVRSDDDIQAAERDLLQRNKQALVADLKDPAQRDAVLDLVDRADASIEGFRPGVAERLGIGPEVCLERNPRLVYGRITGWGRGGPLSAAAGHDINYIALAGALHAVGPAGGSPVPPLAYVGDFGGGGMSLAFGMTAALWESRGSGKGQVVDASIVDGAALLTLPTRTLLSAGEWTEQRGSNLLDGGAPFYGVYETKDHQYISVGPLESQFYLELLDALGIASESLPPQSDREQWPALRERLAAVFRSRTRDEWCEALEGTEVCFAPVLTMAEAPKHPHNAAREVFLTVGGVLQPAPTPRYSRTPAATPRLMRQAAEGLPGAWGPVVAGTALETK